MADQIEKEIDNENEEEKRDAQRNVSDLNDPGDQEAGDVGLPGGVGSDDGTDKMRTNKMSRGILPKSKED